MDDASKFGFGKRAPSRSGGGALGCYFVEFADKCAYCNMRRQTAQARASRHKSDRQRARAQPPWADW